MLESIFIKLLILSVQAGFIILATIVIRELFKKLPKRVICLLWCMAALRLLIPVTIESPVSLIPTEKAIQDVFSVENENGIVWETEFCAEQLSTNGNKATEVQEASVYTGNTMAGVPGTDSNVETTYHYEEKGNNGLNVRMPVIMLWLLGTVLLLSYGVFTYAQVCFKVYDAVHLNDNIWLSDRIDTPFLLGYIKPRIYMPFFVDESRREYIIAHEMGHIKRGDHLTKLIGYILLCVYWFQPLVWIAYVLFCKDVEMACDEKVIGELGEEKKRAYSQTLLLCSVNKHYLLANPLAFGEIDVKRRINNILSYKKPGVVISVISVILLVIVAVCFLTNRKEEVSQGTTELSEYQKEYLGILEDGIRYTVLPMRGAEEPLVLFTEGTFNDSAYGSANVSIYSFYCIYGQVGTIQTGGTAYPIRYDEEAVYLEDGHGVSVLTVSEEVSPIAGMPFLVSAHYGESDKDYEKMLAKCHAASVVDFSKTIENAQLGEVEDGTILNQSSHFYNSEGR